MCGQRWSGADEIELLSRWGSEPLSKTAKKLRRTRKACTSKMDRMVGSNATDRGRHTLSSVAEDSGYHRDTISAAVRSMGLRRVVKSDGGQWLLTDEQVERIMTHLRDRGAGGFTSRYGRRSHVWSRDHAGCVDCSTEERPHWALGRCRSCYEKRVRCQ